MSDALAKKQWVVVMNGNLVSHVDDDVVESIKQAIKNGVEVIELPDGSLIPSRSIGILSPKAYDNLSRYQRGMWVCKYNSWHNKNENCECGRL